MAQPQPKVLARRLTAIGLTTLATETEENRSIANCALELEGNLALPEVHELLGNPEAGFVRNFRFRSKVVDGSFVEIPGFDARSVIKPFNIPAEASNDHEKWLLDYVGAAGTDPLNEGDKDLPLWECRVLHGYHGGNTMLHIRFHHCMVDGASLMMLFYGLSDEAKQQGMGVEKKQAEDNKTVKAKASFLRVLVRALFTVGAGSLVFLFGAILVLLKHFRGLFRSKAGSPFKGKLGVQKSLKMSDKSFDVNLIKAAGKKRGKFTVNDVMLAAYAGAIRRWMETKHGPAAVRPGTSVTCALPVNLRKGNDMYIGNKIGAFTVELPVGEADLERRLKMTAAQCGAAKNSPEADLGYMLGKVAYVLPTWGSKQLMGKMTAGVECVFTNVKGFDSDFHIRGHKVLKSLGFVPPPPGVSLGCACMSMHGKVLFSISSDRTLLGEDAAGQLVEFFEQEVRALVGDQ